MTTNFTTIDKLLTTLLRSEDGNAIIANFAGLKRKLDAAKLDVHKLELRPVKKDAPTVTSFNASQKAATLAEQALDDERAEHRATKQRLKQAEAYSDSLTDDLETEKRETARWTKMAVDYEHDLNKMSGLVAKAGWVMDNKTGEYTIPEAPAASGDVLEVITAAIKADRVAGHAESMNKINRIKTLEAELVKAHAAVKADNQELLKLRALVDKMKELVVG